MGSEMCIRDRVLNVCPIERLNVSFIIQNAASFGIVMVLLPAAVASMSSVGSTWNTGISGATMPAAVMAETAPCPVAQRIMTVMIQARISGEIESPVTAAAICCPTPASTMTCLNTPPAPMMRTTVEIPLIALVIDVDVSSTVRPARIPNT